MSNPTPPAAPVDDFDDMIRCQRCGDLSYICDTCRHADWECTCEDGPTLVPCPDCLAKD